jgi:shikimate kinase
MQNNNIILMGFMGVGKGSLARELARQTGRIAIDTDDLIESMENRKVKKIFEKEDENYFRNKEKELASWLENSVKDSIISIGGGFYQVGNLQKIGHVVYLESSFDAILDRINSFDNASKKLKKRPLLQDISKAKNLINERHPKYVACADTVIQTAGKTTEVIAQQLIKLLELISKTPDGVNKTEKDL